MEEIKKREEKEERKSKKHTVRNILIPSVLAVIALLLSAPLVLIHGVQGDQGEQGEKGPNGGGGSDGSNGLDGEDGKDGSTFLYGSGAPSSILGKDNDVYLDISSGQYYLKKDSSWEKQYNFKGLSGDSGNNGTSGNSGTSGNNGNNGTLNYSSIISYCENGSISVDKGSTKVGDELTYTITPISFASTNSTKKYYLKDLFINGVRVEEVSINNNDSSLDSLYYTFKTTMNSEGNVISANFECSDQNEYIAYFDKGTLKIAYATDGYNNIIDGIYNKTTSFENVVNNINKNLIFDKEHSGTSEEDAILITSASDWNKLRDIYDKFGYNYKYRRDDNTEINAQMKGGIYYKLANDIDLENNTKNICINRFNGILDGDNHTVKNLTTNSLNSNNLTSAYCRSNGMFWDAYGEITIKNLNVEFKNLDNTYYFNGVKDNAPISLMHGTNGSLATKLTLENITLNGDQMVFQDYSYAPFICLLDGNNMEVSFINCVNNVNVINGDGKTAAFIGRLKNSNFKKIEFIDCVNNGNIIATDDNGGYTSILFSHDGNIETLLDKNVITVTNFKNNGTIRSFKSSESFNLLNSIVKKDKVSEYTDSSKYDQITLKDLTLDSTKKYQDLFTSSEGNKFGFVINSVFTNGNNQSENQDLCLPSLVTDTNLYQYNISNDISNVTFDTTSDTTLIERDVLYGKPKRRLTLHNGQYYYYLDDYDNKSYTGLSSSKVKLTMFQFDDNNKLVHAKLFVMNKDGGTTISYCDLF